VSSSRAGSNTALLLGTSRWIGRQGAESQPDQSKRKDK
jgi:hypothetical protein